MTSVNSLATRVKTAAASVVAGLDAAFSGLQLNALAA